VLYGSNAFSGIINVVTRGRTSPNGADVGLSTSQYGTVRGRAGVRWSRGNMGFWASVAGAYGVGRDFYFPELARPAMGTTPAVDGNSRGADGFQAGTVTGRFWWRDFTLQWLYNVRHKSVATGEYDTQLGNPGTFWRDSRGFVEARFEPHLTDTVQLFTRAYANQFGFRSRYIYGGDVENDQEDFLGLVVGAEARVVWNPFRALRLTVGTEGQFHVIAQQSGGPVSNPTAYNNRDNPYQIAAGYISLDGSPTDWFRYSAAARLDWYSTFGATINPRLALIFHPYARGTLKVMGGSAFRAPAVAELYYQSETQLANPNVQPERTYSGEIEYSHRLSSAWTLLGSGFVNYTTNLIALADVPGMTDVIQYQNNSTPIVTLGAEAEVRREWRQGWMASASYSFQRSRFSGADAASLREVPNSPEHLFSLRGSAPVVAGVFLVTSRLSFEGPRFDRNFRATDPAQGTTDLALLWDIVLSGRVDRWGLRYAIGAYNIIDWRYSVPVSPEFPVSAVPQNGRTFLASMGLDF
jgi:outer membrane cobalamin receptor